MDIITHFIGDDPKKPIDILASKKFEKRPCITITATSWIEIRRNKFYGISFWKFYGYLSDIDNEVAGKIVEEYGMWS